MANFAGSRESKNVKDVRKAKGKNMKPAVSVMSDPRSRSTKRIKDTQRSETYSAVERVVGAAHGKTDFSRGYKDPTPKPIQKAAAKKGPRPKKRTSS